MCLVLVFLAKCQVKCRQIFKTFFAKLSAKNFVVLSNFK